SLFMAEAQTFFSQVFQNASASPFSLIVMDEILPGTIREIREDLETIFLQELAKTGAITMTSTHNWGATGLAKASPQTFRNFHVSKFAVIPGETGDLETMYQGAALALKKAGTPQYIIDELLAKGKERLGPSESAK